MGPDNRPLVARRVDPVDPRPPAGRIDRARSAKDQHRHPVAPGIEDRHCGVEQADIGVHGDSQRLAGHLGPALRHCHRVLLVQAEQHLWSLVAEVVHQAVVQATKTRPWRQRDIWNVERTQRLRHHVAAEHGITRGATQGPLDAGSSEGVRQRIVHRSCPPHQAGPVAA